MGPVSASREQISTVSMRTSALKKKTVRMTRPAWPILQLLELRVAHPLKVFQPILRELSSPIFFRRFRKVDHHLACVLQWFDGPDWTEAGDRKYWSRPIRP